MRSVTGRRSLAPRRNDEPAGSMAPEFSLTISCPHGSNNFMNSRHLLLPLAVLTVSLTGCVHAGWSYKAVPDITMSRGDDPAATGPVLLRTEGAAAPQTPAALPPSKIDAQFRPPARQTVLVAQYKQDLGGYDTTLGKTLIVCLDGAPKPGEYWLTPDNAVLVTYSSYS